MNWIDVGYYQLNDNKLNTFQLVIIDRSDIATGDFDLEFNYRQIQWEAGDVSGGDDGIWVGPGGSPARAGYASFVESETFELDGSGDPTAFLDSNTATGLIYHSFNSPEPGRYVFQFRSGAPLQTP